MYCVMYFSKMIDKEKDVLQSGIFCSMFVYIHTYIHTYIYIYTVNSLIQVAPLL